MKKPVDGKGLEKPQGKPIKENIRTLPRNLLSSSPSFKRLPKEDQKELDQDLEPTDP